MRRSEWRSAPTRIGCCSSVSSPLVTFAESIGVTLVNVGGLNDGRARAARSGTLNTISQVLEHQSRGVLR